MDGTFVEELVRASRVPKKETIHGREHLVLPDADGSWQLAELDTPESLPTPLQVATLSGLVDYLLATATARDQVKASDVLVHIVNHGRVDVCGRLLETFAQRATYITAQFAPLFGDQFKFGTFYDAETFNVALQSLFVDTPDRAAVLKCVGTIKENDVRQTEDDGVTQTVTASSGVVLVGEANVPNPVTLCPYRTFRELAQPASAFVLRLRPGKGEKPECALFEADGGWWKLQAIDAIAQYLKGKLADYAVIA